MGFSAALRRAGISFGPLCDALYLVDTLPADADIEWILGTLDLLDAIALATIHEAAPFMGAAYWIPAFWVPALLVTHYITFAVLLKPWARP